jgi:hypothetical protein
MRQKKIREEGERSTRKWIRNEEENEREETEEEMGNS